MEDLLAKALNNLDKPEKYDICLEILEQHWFHTIHDIKLAMDDSETWARLPLPERLKLEMKRLAREYENEITSEFESLVDQWTRYFSKEHNAFYFYNQRTGETRWDEEQDTHISTEHVSPSMSSVFDNLVRSFSPAAASDINSTSPKNSLTGTSPVENSTSPLKSMWAVERDASRSPGYFTPKDIPARENAIHATRKASNYSPDNSISKDSEEDSDENCEFDPDMDTLMKLVSMGFDQSSAFEALEVADNDLNLSVEFLTSKI